MDNDDLVSKIEMLEVELDKLQKQNAQYYNVLKQIAAWDWKFPENDRRYASMAVVLAREIIPYERGQ